MKKMNEARRATIVSLLKIFQNDSPVGSTLYISCRGNNAPVRVSVYNYLGALHGLSFRSDSVESKWGAVEWFDYLAQNSSVVRVNSAIAIAALKAKFQRTIRVEDAK